MEGSYYEMSLVHDIETDNLLELVTFRDDYFSREEFELILSLQYKILNLDHPYIMKNYDFGIVSEINKEKQRTIKYYYTREYNEKSSTTLTNYLDLTRDESNTALFMLMKAINFLFFRGLYLNELTLSNIYIYKEDKAVHLKISDIFSYFIIMKDINVHDKALRQFKSTESMWDYQATKHSTIFSLGKMIFYFYFRVDFTQESFDRDIKKYTNNEIVELIRKMTDENTELRPDDVFSIALTLSNLVNNKYDFSDIEYYRKTNKKIEYIDGFNHLKAIQDEIFHKANYSSKFNGSIITGSKGLGKTRLLDEIERRMTFSGIETIRINVKSIPAGKYSFLNVFLDKLLNTTLVNFDTIKKYNEEIKFLREENELSQDEMSYLRINNRIFNLLNDISNLRPLVILIDDGDLIQADERLVIRYIYENTKKNLNYLVSTLSLKEDDVDKTLDKAHLVKLQTYTHELTGEMIKRVLGMSYRPIKATERVQNLTGGIPNMIVSYVEQAVKFGDFYIEENRNWYMKNIDDFNLDNESNSMESILKNRFSELNDEYKQILYAIALFKLPICITDITQLVDTKVSNLLVKVNKLCDDEILNEIIDEKGYFYDFRISPFRDYVIGQIPSDIKFHIRKRAVDLLERVVGNYPVYSKEYLVDLYVELSEYNKANQMARESYEELLLKKDFNGAISFLYQTIKSNTLSNNELKNLQLYIKLAEIQSNLGLINEYSDSSQMIIDLSKRFSDNEGLAIGLLNMVSIKTNNSELGEAIEILREVKSISKVSNNNFGILKSNYLECKILLLENKLEEYDLLIEESLNYSIEIYDIYFIGMFFNEKGISMSLKNDKEKALEYFLSSYDYLQKSNKPADVSRPLNNLGVYYLEIVGDLDKARENFIKSYEVLNDFGIIDGQVTYLLNISDTYFLKEEFDKSLEFVKKAENISNVQKYNNYVFQIHYNYYNIYLKSNQFDKAFVYYKKLLNEYYYSKDRGLEKVYFFLQNVELFTHLKDYKNANDWLGKLLELGKLITESIINRLQIVEYKVKRIKNFDARNIFTEDLKFLNEIHPKLTSYEDKWLLREFILEICLEKVLSNRIFDLSELLGIDEILSKEAPSNIFKERRFIYTEYINNSDLRELEYIAKNSENGTNRGISSYICAWTSFINNDMKNATKYAIYAFSEVINSINKTPNEFKANYIFNDKFKIDVRNLLSSIKMKIFGYSHDAVSMFYLNEIGDINEFMNMKDYEKIVSSADIINEGKNILSGEEYFSDMEYLIQNFSANDKKNLLSILKYISQITLSETSAILITNSNREILEIISETNDTSFSEVHRFLKSQSKDEIFVSELFNIGDIKVLDKDQKAIALLNIRKQYRDYSTTTRAKVDFVSIGYLYLSTESPFNNFTNESLKKIKNIMPLIYLILEKIQLNKISTVDSLTGVYLRDYVINQIVDEVKSDQSKTGKFSIIMADIDKFKELNDNYGHRKGDEVLKEIGSVFMSSLRETDVVGRYGGEEFILFLPNSGEDEAFMISERIRKEIERLEFIGLDRNVTVSFGISSFPNHGTSKDELIEHADKALYFSKSNGRNKTSIWNIEINNSTNRFDKLAGIIEGKVANDSKNAQAIIDLITFSNASLDKVSKIDKMLNTLMDIVEAKYASFVVKNDKLIDVYSKVIYKAGIVEGKIFEDSIYSENQELESGRFYVDWRNITEINPVNGMKSWRSIIYSPIYKNGEYFGMLILGTPIYEKEFEFNDMNFVTSVCTLFANVF
jgi:diguanylate cyclase (GGDEF)-like protein